MGENPQRKALEHPREKYSKGAISQGRWWLRLLPVAGSWLLAHSAEQIGLAAATWRSKGENGEEISPRKGFGVLLHRRAAQVGKGAAGKTTSLLVLSHVHRRQRRSTKGFVQIIRGLNTRKKQSRKTMPSQKSDMLMCRLRVLLLTPP